MELIATLDKLNNITKTSSDSDSDSDSSSSSDSDSSSDSSSSDEDSIVVNNKSKYSLENELYNIEDDYIVNIRVKQRNSRKYTTTIENIPEKYFIDKDKLKTFLVKLRNAISSRATFKDEQNIKFIEVSGNKTAIIVKHLCCFLDCSPKIIKIHGI